jgi:hypothetical protein
MPPAAAKTRLVTLVLWLPVAVATVTCIILPVIGARGYFPKFKQPYSAEYHVRLLAPQLIGPVFTLLTSLALLLAVIFRKRLPWWLWLIPLIGAPYTIHAVNQTGISHDFSHAVFDQCSGIYGNWITCISIFAGAALLAIALLARRDQRRPLPPSP